MEKKKEKNFSFQKKKIYFIYFLLTCYIIRFVIKLIYIDHSQNHEIFG
jgi:preprotein translocase subunit SecY